MATGKYVSYLRVSTARQGRDGLGIDAQRAAVERFLDGGNWKLIKEFVEVESGKNNDRPELTKALRHAKLTGARLILAKLDRLSRDLAFIANLQNSGAKFVCADMPDANELTIHLMAALAQHERRMISQRTREGLASIKRRLKSDGVYTTKAGRKIRRLGNPDGVANLWPGRNPKAQAALRAKADKFASELAPVIDDIRSNGITTVRGIADELNERSIVSARGGRWNPSSVALLLRRLD